MKELRYALTQMSPILFSYIFVGLAFGILVNQQGYSLWWTLASCLFIYAGSMQIILLTFMSAGMPLSMVAVMTLFINGRHIFYGLGFVERFRKTGYRYPFMALTLTDETFSVLSNIKYPEGYQREDVDFYLSLACYLLWSVSCLMGCIFGKALPWDLRGIEFSAIAFFATVVVNQWKDMKSHIPAVVGLGCALVGYFVLGADRFILPALTASVVLLIFLKPYVQQEKEAYHER